MHVQSRVAKLVPYVWLAITPFKIAIGLKVRGVLESSHHYWNFVISTKNGGENWV